MKNALLARLFLLFCKGALFAQTSIELPPNQSMLLYGKGPGQDATINPYDGEDCYALIENFGTVPFSVRIQQQKTIIYSITIPSKTTKKIRLRQGHALYLDPASKLVAKARIQYEAMEVEQP